MDLLLPFLRMIGLCVGEYGIFGDLGECKMRMLGRGGFNDE